jgi:hypothetical protein
MALSDYRLCDICESKAFYDSNLSYETGERQPDKTWRYPENPFRVAGEDQGKYGAAIGNVGDWAVICTDCAKTHKTIIVPLDAAAKGQG